MSSEVLQRDSATFTVLICGWFGIWLVLLAALAFVSRRSVGKGPGILLPLSPTHKRSLTGFRAVIARLPVELNVAHLAIVGLGGLWRQLGTTFALEGVYRFGEAFCALGVAEIAVLQLLFCAKLALCWTDLKQEFAHRTNSVFFGCVPLNIMLLSGGLLPWLANSIAPVVIWCVGAGLSHVWCLFAVSRWSLDQSDHHLEDFGTFFFVPTVVLNLVPALYGAGLHGLFVPSFYLYCVGLFFYLVLVVIIFQRLLLRRFFVAPGLWIMVAASAVIAVTHFELFGSFDYFSQGWLCVGTFKFLLLARITWTYRSAPFSLSWLSTGFPLVAFARCWSIYDLVSVESGNATPATFFVTTGLAALATVWNVWLVLRIIVSLVLESTELRLTDEASINAARPLLLPGSLANGDLPVATGLKHDRPPALV